MWKESLSDPKVRRAYVTTKAGVFAAAAIVTIPLAKAFGPKMWVGLGAFGLILGVLTVAVLSAGGGRETDATSGSDDGEDEGASDPDPDDPMSLPIEDWIDLHPFTPKDIPDVVESYLESAVERGFTEVRLIHGRGIGVQRERVRSVLERHPAVVGFADAPPDRGGWGATVARIGPRTDPAD